MRRSVWQPRDDQVTRHLLAIAHHVLGGRRFVIDVAGIDLGAVIEQVRRDLDRAGEMERRLAVPAAGVHQVRVERDQFAQSVHHAQACRGVHVDDGAPLDRIGGQLGAGPVKSPKPARPPPTLRVQVGTRVEQDIQHRAAADVDDRGRIERAQRLVDLRLQLGMALEELRTWSASSA